MRRCPVNCTIDSLCSVVIGRIRAHEKLLRWLLATVFVALTGGYLLHHSDQLSFVLELDWRFLLVALVMLLAYLCVLAWRLLVIMRYNGLQGITFPSWFRILIVARFLGKWVPEAGTVYRGVRLKTEYGFAYTKYASSFTSSGWLSVILDLMLALGLTVLLEPGLRIGSWIAGRAIGAVLVVVVGGPIALHLLLLRIQLPRGALSRAHGVLSEVVSKTVEGIQDLQFVGRVSLLGALAFVTTALKFHFLLQAFGISTTVPVVALFVCLLNLSGLLNLTPGNLGVQELAYGFLGSAVGIGAAQGILASGASRAMSYAVHSALAAVFGGVALLKPKEPAQR